MNKKKVCPECGYESGKQPLDQTCSCLPRAMTDKEIEEYNLKSTSIPYTEKYIREIIREEIDKYMRVYKVR